MELFITVIFWINFVALMINAIALPLAQPSKVGNLVFSIVFNILIGGWAASLIFIN